MQLAMLVENNGLAGKFAQPLMPESAYRRQSVVAVHAKMGTSIIHPNTIL